MGLCVLLVEERRCVFPPLRHILEVNLADPALESSAGQDPTRIANATILGEREALVRDALVLGGARPCGLQLLLPSAIEAPHL